MPPVMTKPPEGDPSMQQPPTAPTAWGSFRAGMRRGVGTKPMGAGPQQPQTTGQKIAGGLGQFAGRFGTSLADKLRGVKPPGGGG